VDDQAVGLALRRVRLRRNERQCDVAKKAGVSTSVYSGVERGNLDATTLRTLRKVAAALEVRLEVTVRWHGGDLDRLVSARHAAMSQSVARVLIEAGWEVVPELSFNHFGERGAIDLVAWHAGRRALLLIELKTEIVEVNGLLGTADRRRRLTGVIARERGWSPLHVGTWIVVADSRTSRRRLAAHRELVRAAFPEDGRQVSGWLAEPIRDQAAFWFLTDSGTSGLGRGLAPLKRVTRRRANVEAAAAS
jgi:transcriptional regulator with XRE-family HTH domain